MLSFNNFKKVDWFLVVIVFVLVAFGLAAIYSVDLSRGEDLNYFPTQVIALVIGFGLMLSACFLHISFYRVSARAIYILALLLLVLVLFFGINVRGTTGWFRLAGFSFQPAEFAKVALVLLLAWIISRYGRRFDKWKFVFVTGGITVLLAGIIILQPDLGSALVLLGVWFCMMFLTGTKKRYIAGLIIIFITVFLLSWLFIFKDYQRDRILTFIDPGRDPLGAGYNVTQSIIAIGSGGFFGRGLGFGSQSQLHFLPEAQTDFIFSVICEELGFVGVFILIMVYFLLLWRLLQITKKSNDDFSVYLILGILLLFFVQMIVNIGGAVGFLPVTGVTLPFVSYGGSSLIINFLLIGMALSAARS
ncbi:MAG: rod shape-determining protein RodA [Candidatus Magasanikiibacteriota bacterium]